MRIVVGADHRGFELKNQVADYLRAQDHDVIDIGTNSTESVDYPDIALDLGRRIIDGEAERGILVCGSGVGACVAANKLPGIRAAITHDTYSAHQGVEHDDMNVICLGSHIIGVDAALEAVKAFVAAQFDPQERYVRRHDKVLAIEQETRKQKITG
ncbi:MAG TPA: ribose 5-phosphate isomerase B [Dehalococcoidia bacterium]|nr:ribose 5-phosphate isomerase B [Dehalococcoidia bacterium]